MLVELQSLWRRWNQLSAFADEAGGSNNDDPEKNDPFENFDFTRFTPSRRRQNPPTPPAGFKAKDEDSKPKKNDPDDDKEDEPTPRRNRENTFDGFRTFQGGRGGRGGNVSVSVQMPDLKLPRPSRRAIFFIILGVLVVALFIIVPNLLNFWADWMWFDEMGQTGVMWTRTLWPILLYVVGFALAFLVIMVNVGIARRFGPSGPVVQLSANNPLSALQGGGLRFLNALFVVGAIILSLIMAGAASSEWQMILFYLNAANWDQKETIFGNKIGFYIYDVPFYGFLQGWLVGLLIITLLAVMAIYFLRYSLSGRSFVFSRAIKTHASVLGALILGLFAFGYQISNWKLVYSTRGRVFGASATDVDAQLPANTILTFIVAAAALLLVANIFIRDTRWGGRLLVAAATIWLVSLILIGGVFPSLYQNFSVKPNEISKEQPYIANTIKMTRAGFGLTQNQNIKEVNFPGTAQLSQQDIQSSPALQGNVRLWDYDKLKQIYDTTQTLRKYYDFRDVDIDRYKLALNGQPATPTQIMISARQLNLDQLPSQTWVATHLQYTHGYGIQASPVNAVDTSGSPVNLITQNFPISSTILPVDQPRIYYGEAQSQTPQNDYSIVGGQEIDFPFQQGDQQQYYSYQGKGGIKLSNFAIKAAFSLKLNDFNLLISDAVNDNSRLIFRRTITERINELAPYLLLDPDPYLVVADGRLYWIQDAYTTSELYPHSKPYTDGDNSYNYIRNSVKIVLDAYDGTTTFYLMDKPDGVDPLAQTYANIYPSLYKPVSQMPASLRAHLRYPEYLFNVQASVYETYHVTDPVRFYNNEDLWQIPSDPRKDKATPLESYYLQTRLPGEQQSEFLLMNVFQPQNKFNLVSWIAARSDGDNYGQLVAYNFNQSVNLDGPAQFYSRLQALSSFSQRQSLLNQGSSRLPAGPIIITPVDDSLLYVLPYYLQGSNTALPQLQMVAVGANDKVYVADAITNDDRTKLLPTAINDVFTRGEQVAAQPGQPGGATTTPATGGTPGATGTPPPITTAAPLPTSGANGVAAGPTVGPNQSASIAELVRSIQSHQQMAAQAFQSGDTNKGNAELQAASADLARLNQLLGR